MGEAYSKRRWWAAPGAVILPFAVMTAGLAAGPDRSGDWDYFVGSLALLAAAVLICCLPLHPLFRLTILLAYLPCLAVALVIYSFAYVGWAYDRYL